VATLAAIVALAATFKFGIELRVLRRVADDDFSPLHKTALLHTERFGLVNRCRLAGGLAGAICGPALLVLRLSAAGPGAVPSPALTWLAALLFALCLAGEFIERRLFFTTVQPVRMPGTFAP
jgi:DMSO reductase anchor subunit